MAIKQTHVGAPGSEQGMGVDVGAQPGTGTLGSDNQASVSQTPTAPHGTANLNDFNDVEDEPTASSTGTYQSGMNNNQR